jgi:hypothetical protein
MFTWIERLVIPLVLAQAGTERLEKCSAGFPLARE